MQEWIKKIPVINKRQQYHICHSSSFLFELFAFQSFIEENTLEYLVFKIRAMLLEYGSGLR
jgi:hypothetical protein